MADPAPASGDPGGPGHAARPAQLLRKRGIYLLPNLFTTLNLFAGFYAIVQGMNHEY